MMLSGPCRCNPTGGLVSGHWYRAVAFNGAVFEFWMGHKLKRPELCPTASAYADPGIPGETVYGPEDFDSVRKVKGPGLDDWTS